MGLERRPPRLGTWPSGRHGAARTPTRSGMATTRPLPSEIVGEDDPARAVTNARTALAHHVVLANVRPPDGPPRGSFAQASRLLNAARAYRSTGILLDPDAVLRHAAIGVWNLERGSSIDRAEGFLEAYGRPPSGLDADADDPDAALELAAGSGAGGLDWHPSLATFAEQLRARQRGLEAALRPDALETAARRMFGPAVRIRHDRGYHGPIERAWVHDRLRRAPADELRERLAALATWAADDRRDPLTTAAGVYAGVLEIQPFRQANVAVAIYAADLAIRCIAGVASADVGLGGLLAERIGRHRAALRSAVLDGDERAWRDAFLSTVLDAVQRTSERRRAHLAAYRAVRSRLESRAGLELLGRRRRSLHRIADLAARWPYLAIARLVDAGVAERVAAGHYLNALVRLGVGVPQRYGRYRLVRLSSLADAVGAEAPAHGLRPGLDELVAAARRLRYVDPHDA